MSDAFTTGSYTPSEGKTDLLNELHQGAHVVWHQWQAKTTRFNEVLIQNDLVILNLVITFMKLATLKTQKT